MIEILHVQTAVYGDCLPRDIASFVGRQKCADLRDVADLASAFERNVRNRRLDNRGGKNRRHVGVDEPGGDRVYRDVPRRKLPRERLSYMAEMQRRFTKDLGVPCAGFDGDQADPRNFNEAQYATRVQGLVEAMEANKKD